MTRFSARDDLLHDVSQAGPHARESLLFTAPIPDEQLLVFVYVWREEGDAAERSSTMEEGDAAERSSTMEEGDAAERSSTMEEGDAVAGPTWGRFVFVGGPDMHAPEFLSHDADAAFDGADLDDCVVGGVTLRQPEPLRSAEVAFAGEGLELALRFEGLHEPFSWHDNADGCPSWVADDRYEQSCRTSGTLTLHGRTVTVDAAGHRDHSWGSRNWNMLQHWKWMNATAGDDLSLHAMIMDVQGERLVNGYLNIDGVVSPVATAEAHADLDDRMVHRAVRGTFTDEQGRTLELDASYAAGWSMPIRHLLLNEIGMTATLGGRPAIAHVELGWPAEYVRALTP